MTTVTKYRDRELNDEVLGRGIVRLYVSFAPNGASNATVTANQAKKGIQSVTALSAGLVNVQLGTNYQALLHSDVSLQTTDNTTCWTGRVITSQMNATGGSMLTVAMYANNALTNVVAAAANIVTMQLVMSRTRVWS